MPLPQNVPTAVVQLDRPRTIAYTLGAMRRIRDVTGEKIGTISLDADGFTDRLGLYVWASLVDEDRAGLDVLDVENMIHGRNMDTLTNAFLSLVAGGDGPQSEESDEGKAPGKTAN